MQIRLLSFVSLGYRHLLEVCVSPCFFSWPGGSPGRAIVLSPALALALASALAKC